MTAQPKRPTRTVIVRFLLSGSLKTESGPWKRLMSGLFS
jgi:hypothetical protein